MRGHFTHHNVELFYHDLFHMADDLGFTTELSMEFAGCRARFPEALMPAV